MKTRSSTTKATRLPCKLLISRPRLHVKQPRSAIISSAASTASAAVSAVPFADPEIPSIRPKRRDPPIGRAQRCNDPSNATFTIESIVCGDGRKTNSGITLKDNVWYASERLDGGGEFYYEIDPQSIVLSTRGGRTGGGWHTRSLTGSEATDGQVRGPRINIPKKKRKNHTWVKNKLKDGVLKYCTENRGRAVSIGGPGARDEIADVDKYLVQDHGEILVKQNDGNCITAAIVNALDAVAGREIAASVQEYFYEVNPHYLKIREATPVLNDLRTCVEMRKIPKGERALFDENPFAYLACRGSGVFIAHVFQPKVVSHTIVVDAGRKLIIDSSEDYPMRLSEELLRKCGGEQATELRIGEVAMIVSQTC